MDVALGSGASRQPLAFWPSAYGPWPLALECPYAEADLLLEADLNDL